MKGLEITEELLTEVLDLEVDMIYDVNSSKWETIYQYDTIGFQTKNDGYKSIPLFLLVEKCLEWAAKEGYILDLTIYKDTEKKIRYSINVSHSLNNFKYETSSNANFKTVINAIRTVVEFKNRIK